LSAPVVERARLLAAALPTYARIAWSGMAAPRLPGAPDLLVVQAVILREGRVLLAVRGDLRGWELPGGAPEPGESDESALVREVREETGLSVEILRRVGDYQRSGFLPHLARVFLCRAAPGPERPSPETPRLRWFDVRHPPATLFPWYRGPLADALADRAEPVERRERQGVGHVLAGLRIDLRMRISGDTAGATPTETAITSSSRC
jgi:8-oxo-dGTP pyrophosphatase MutT (NUDIX family)